MKIWNSFGSEHSSNWVMIGTFRDVASAEEASKAIEEVRDFVSRNSDDNSGSDRYSDGALELLRRLDLYIIQPRELDQFGYEFRVKTDKERVVVSTDETEISGIMKILVENGGRVEIYSAHQYEDTGEGR